MKKILALVLALALVLGCAAAFADGSERRSDGADVLEHFVRDSFAVFDAPFLRIETDHFLVYVVDDALRVIYRGMHCLELCFSRRNAEGKSIRSENMYDTGIALGIQPVANAPCGRFRCIACCEDANALRSRQTVTGRAE